MIFLLPVLKLVLKSTIKNQEKNFSVRFVFCSFAAPKRKGFTPNPVAFSDIVNIQLEEQKKDEKGYEKKRFDTRQD